MSLNHLSLSQYDSNPESHPLFIKATKHLLNFKMGVMKQYSLKNLKWSQWFTKFVTIFHNPCHVTPWAASILLSVQKILLLLSSRVYLESMSGPSSGRNDVLLCPQIVHNWRTENAYLSKNIHTHTGGGGAGVDVSTSGRDLVLGPTVPPSPPPPQRPTSWPKRPWTSSCPYVSHSFRCCAFLINGLLRWGRVASQPFQVDPGRVLVGGGHHDHRRLRGHDVGPSSACWSHDLFFSSVMSQETHTLTYTHHLSMALHHLLLCFSCQQQKCMTAVFN